MDPFLRSKFVFIFFLDLKGIRDSGNIGFFFDRFSPWLPFFFYDRYKELGLSSCPNKGDNGVHASASPFEGLAEKANWLKRTIEGDTFGKAILAKGIPLATIKAWSVDPRVEVPGGGKGSVFDALEDLDSEDCLKKLAQLYALNRN